VSAFSLVTAGWSKLLEKGKTTGKGKTTARIESKKRKMDG